MVLSFFGLYVFYNKFFVRFVMLVVWIAQTRWTTVVCVVT